jgi:hypothetical protein
MNNWQKNPPCLTMQDPTRLDSPSTIGTEGNSWSCRSRFLLACEVLRRSPVRKDLQAVVGW